MNTLERRTLSALALAAALAMAPAGTQAQECTATVRPVALEPGSKAAEVTVTLSEEIGAVTGIASPEGSGITVASPRDLPRTEMAAENEAPKPIRMGESANSWTVWLNLSEAKPGTHRVVFQAGTAECPARLVVRSRG